MNTLISALEETLAYLEVSDSSDYSHTTVTEIISKLESEINKAKNSMPIDLYLLGLLFAPTGAVQETSIDNGWSEDYLRICEVVDQFTERKK